MGLEIHHDKTKIIKMKTKSMQGSALDKVEHFKFLGSNIERDLNLNWNPNLNIQWVD